MEQVCRLRFRLRLRPTPAGLAYRQAGFDSVNDFDLEELLRLAPGPGPQLDRMQHRLCVALAHW